MNVSTLRVVLALLVVGGFVGMVSTLFMAAVFIDLDDAQRAFVIELLEEISKVMAGFIGLIIGYYFSRPDAASDDTAGSGPSDSQAVRVSHPPSDSG